MSKKQENPLQEAVGIFKSIVRHRKGFTLFGKQINQLKFGKKVLHLDNEIPGKILDTFDNLGYLTKDKRRPVLVAKRRTAYGWHLVFNLPPGISFSKVKRQREYFQDATNSWIDFFWNGKLHMDVHMGKMPKRLPYDWYEGLYKKMSLPIPIGVSQSGEVVFDLAESPHLLVAGVPGFGKSNFLHVLIHSLLPRARIGIIDLKRLEFAYLKNHCALARNEHETQHLLLSVNKEMERRIDVLESAGVVKIQDYKGEDMPFIVVIIDELAEISADFTMDVIDRITRLARAVGISVIAATQRPSTKVLPGDTRAMFQARLCFQVADELNSRMVLGEGCPLAAHLPGIKGRAIWKFGLDEKEVQTMFLPLAQAKKLLQQQQARGRGWQYEPQTKRLPPR